MNFHRTIMMILGTIQIITVILFYIQVTSCQTIPVVEFVEDPFSTGETIKAIYGKTAYVPCVITSKEMPSYVKWFHDDSEVFAFENNGMVGMRKDRYSFASGLQNGDFTLKIKNVKSEDNGTFNCIVAFGMGAGKSSRRGKIQVYVPPDDNYPQCKTLFNGDHRPTEGDNVKLSCITRGEDPMLQLSWSDVDAKVVHNEITNNLIKDVTLRKEDNGKPYTCSASGLAVNPPRTCTVIPLKVYPTVTFKVAHTDVYQGNDVELECYGTGLPEITEYKWYYDGQFVGQSFERFELSDDKTKLVISDITINDKGKIVVCRVSVTSGLASNVSEAIQVREIVTLKPHSPSIPVEDDYRYSLIIIVIAISSGLVILILILVIVHMCYRKMRIMRQLNLQYQDSLYEEMNGSRCDGISIDKLSMGSLGVINGNTYLVRTPSSRPVSPTGSRRNSSNSVTPSPRNSFIPSRTSSPYFDRRSSLVSSRSNTPPETPSRSGSPAYLSPRPPSDSPFFPRRGSINRSPSPQPISPAGIEPPFLRTLHTVATDPVVPSKRVMELKASEGIPLNQIPSTSTDSDPQPPQLMDRAVEQTYEEMPLTRKVRDWRATSF